MLHYKEPTRRIRAIALCIPKQDRDRKPERHLQLLLNWSDTLSPKAVLQLVQLVEPN